jgi:hypothetical protein
VDGFEGEEGNYFGIDHGGHEGDADGLEDESELHGEGWLFGDVEGVWSLKSW